MATSKYRPSLTAEHIQWLVETCRIAAATDPVALDLLTVLAPFKAKIDTGSMQPAYIVANKAKPTMLEQLGETTPTIYQLRYPSGAVESFEDKETFWEACYQWTLSNPDTSPTPSIIAGAKEHRYLNSLMTDEEVMEFEQATFLTNTDTTGD